MEFKIQQKQAGKNEAWIIDDEKKLGSISGLTKDELTFINTSLGAEHTTITLPRAGGFVFIYMLKSKKTETQTFDACRKAGAELCAICNKHKLDELTIGNLSATPGAAILLAEGMALANYQFLKYRKKNNQYPVPHLFHQDFSHCKRGSTARHNR